MKSYLRYDRDKPLDAVVRVVCLAWLIVGNTLLLLPYCHCLAYIEVILALSFNDIRLTIEDVVCCPSKTNSRKICLIIQ